MQTTSALYKSIVSGPYSCRCKLVVYSNDTLVGEFGMGKLTSMNTKQAMIKDDKLLIGNCISGSIEVSFYPTDSNNDVVEIPRMAKLVPMVQIYNDTNESEWIKKGEYFIDTRATNELSGIMTLTGYDAMLMSEMDYPSDDESEYPKEDIDIVEFIAYALGVEVDERTYDVINAGYSIGLPIGYSCREVLSGIATLYGANFVITDLGKLRAIGIGDIESEVRYLVDENGNVILIGGVAINV